MGSPYTHEEVPGQNGYGTAAGVVGECGFQDLQGKKVE